MGGNADAPGASVGTRRVCNRHADSLILAAVLRAVPTGVDTYATVKGVRSQSAVQGVVAVLTHQRVRTLVALKAIVAVATEKKVAALTATDRVVSSPPVDGVVSRAACEDVVTVRAEDHVVAGRAEHIGKRLRITGERRALHALAVSRVAMFGTVADVVVDAVAVGLAEAGDSRSLAAPGLADIVRREGYAVVARTAGCEHRITQARLGVAGRAGI